MGLDTSHDCWHGSYRWFTFWRNELAKAAGYGMHDGYAEGIDYIPPGVVLQWDRFEDKNFMGEWDDPPEDPLIVLLAHSDCDGIIPHFWTDHLADRLEDLKPKLPEAKPNHADWRAWTQQFIDGLRKAHANGEDVDFH